MSAKESLLMSAMIIQLPPAISRQQLGLVGRLRQLAFESGKKELLDAASELSIAHELFWQKPQAIDAASFVSVWTKARLLYRDLTGEML
jgi:hypothetical protein